MKTKVQTIRKEAKKQKTRFSPYQATVTHTTAKFQHPLAIEIQLGIL
jgi:hypothetical protein